MNISDPIRARARAAADTVAIIRLGGMTVTYREFDRTIDFVAQHLLQLGVRAGHIVVLGFEAPYWHLTAVLALARIGAAVGEPTLPLRLIDACLVENPAGLAGVRVLAVGPAWFQPPGPDVVVNPVSSHQDGDAICRIVSSSGTTGAPKHVALSHHNFQRRIAEKHVSMPLPANPRQVCTIGIGSPYGLRSAMMVLGVGGLVAFTRTRDDILATIDRHSINYLVSSPETLVHLVAARREDAGAMQSLQAIEAGGSSLPLPLFELVRQRLCPIVLSSYGVTEVGSVASAPMDRLVAHPGALGYVVAGVEVEAVDAVRQTLPQGAEGVLRMRGPTCVAGYVDDPVATARYFIDGWFYPGDVGSVTASGLLSVAGRESELINTGGSRRSPHQIEELVWASGAVREVAAFGVANDAGDDDVWVAIVANEPFDATALLNFCRSRAPELAPQFVMSLTNLPRGRSGKLARDELVRLARASALRPDGAGNAVH